MLSRLADPALLALRAELAHVDVLMRNGIMTHEATGLPYFTGYSYNMLYDWDQFFEAIVQIYMGWPSTYMRNGVELFLRAQREDGFIPRSVPVDGYHAVEHTKPFLAQIAWLVWQAYGEIDWLRGELFTRLRRFLDYWLYDMDGDGDGLSEWMSSPHTGMDNQHERAGYWNDRVSAGVDLNCYLVREARAFAALAEVLGDTALVTEYRRVADTRTATIRALLWDDEDGFFYDRNARNGQEFCRHIGYGVNLSWSRESNGPRIKVKSIAAFAALWARVATPEQAQRLVFEHLFNPREFYTPRPFAALAKSERWYSPIAFPGDLGCNWRATVWIPTNYMVYHGLRWYGYRDFASLVARETHQLMTTAGDREYYCAETGQGRGLDPFWGWSLLGHFFPYEEGVASPLVGLE